VRSRQGDEFSSLELLLDTICNMFGLFIFIGMLVALLVSMRAAQVRPPEPVPPVPDPLAADRALVESLRERVQTMQAKADPDGRVDAIRGRLASLEATNDLMERRLQGLERLLQEGGERAAVLAGELPRLRAEVARLQQEVEAHKQAKGMQLRAPRRRQVEGLMPVQVVVCGDRAYWINPWIDRLDEPCRAWSEWNPDAVDVAAGPICEIRECFRGGGQWLIRSVPLRADGGLAVSEASEDWKRSLLELLGRLRTDRHVISLKVAPDAHAAFQQVRDVVAAAGLAYDVAPIRVDDGVYRDEIRDGVATAQ
jgi:hypothetical protein